MKLSLAVVLASVALAASARLANPLRKRLSLK